MIAHGMRDAEADGLTIISNQTLPSVPLAPGFMSQRLPNGDKMQTQ